MAFLQLFALMLPFMPLPIEAKDHQATVWTMLQMQDRFGADKRIEKCLHQVSKKQDSDAFLRNFIALTRQKGIYSVGGLSVLQPESEILAQLKAALTGFSAQSPFEAVVTTGYDRVATFQKRNFALGLVPSSFEIAPFLSVVNPAHPFSASFAVFAQPDASVQQTRAP